MQKKLRDHRLIDALEPLPAVSFAGTLWRVVRDGRAPCQCSGSGGRWDDTTFEVLYTARERDGAIAEMWFHLKRGQPVFPSKVRYRLHELHVELDGALDLSDPVALTDLGVDMNHFGQLSYNERVMEYPRTQAIAEVAHFLDFTGLLVPSARWNCANVVIFCDHILPDALETVKDHGVIDWTAWQAQNK